VKASKEVILSAGTIGTPQILMNSGIGDENELKHLGIPTRVHLPAVGKNLSVHLSLGINYFVNSTDTYDEIIRNSTLRSELLHLWNQTHTGPLADSISEHTAYVRMPNNATIFETHPDPAAGPHTAHFQLNIEVCP
jgi:choline dehydrogenase-like flavoprotein